MKRYVCYRWSITLDECACSAGLTIALQHTITSARLRSMQLHVVAGQPAGQCRKVAAVAYGHGSPYATTPQCLRTACFKTHPPHHFLLCTYSTYAISTVHNTTSGLRPRCSMLVPVPVLTHRRIRGLNSSISANPESVAIHPAVRPPYIGFWGVFL